MYLQSEAWEVVFFKVDLSPLGSLWTLLTVGGLSSCSLFFSWPLDCLGSSETENSWVLESEFNSGVVVLGNVLLDALLFSLVFFGFDESQLLLLEPFGVDLSLDWNFLLNVGWCNIDTLGLVVLSQSGFLGLLRNFLFLRDLFDNWGGSSDLLYGFFVFISVEFIVDVTNVSSSSTLLSWSVISSGSASSVEGMSFRNSLDWSAYSVMSDLSGVFSDSGRNFSVYFFSWSLWCLSGSGFFQLSSFLVSWIEQRDYFFWLFGRLWFRQIDLLHRRRSLGLRMGCSL